MNIKPTNISMKHLYEQGQRKLADAKAEEEKAKIGTLRGGSSGAITDSGEVIGKCHRIAHLRSLGYQEDVTSTEHIMFAAGYSNEDIWLDHLKQGWGDAILCEDEVPVSWMTTNGTVVSGRPDIVLCSGERPDLTPLVGLELKLISSPFSAYNVGAKDMPNLEHIIQASHYMSQLNIPFKLVYTSRSSYNVGFGGMKDTWIKKAPHLLNEDQYKTNPFIVEFNLWVEDDKVYYQGRYGKVLTPVTISGIRDYYEKVSQMGERKILGPRPTSLNADGTERSWKSCDPKYCAFANVCDQYEDNYELWLDYAKLICETKES